MVHIYLPVKKSTNTELMAKKRGHPTFDRPRSKKQTTQILRNKVFEWYSGCFFGAIFLVLFWCSKNKSSFLSLSLRWWWKYTTTTLLRRRDSRYDNSCNSKSFRNQIDYISIWSEIPKITTTRCPCRSQKWPFLFQNHYIFRSFSKILITIKIYCFLLFWFNFCLFFYFWKFWNFWVDVVYLEAWSKF